MDKRKMWVMSEEQFKAFQQHRLQSYKYIGIIHGINSFDDHILQKYYLKGLLSFLRRRKFPHDQPFKMENITYTAAALFKRYYLVNSFIQEQPTQSLICALYTSLKLNEYSDNEIIKWANAWKEKPCFQPDRNHLHIGMEGYTDKQMLFLKGFRFQVGRSPLIQPIQSLYMRIDSHKLIDSLSLCTRIKFYLDQVYMSSDILFLNEGPKIALCIVMLTLQSLSLDSKLLGQEMLEIIKKNEQQLKQLSEKILNIPQFSQKKALQEYDLEKIRMLTRNKFKKPQILRKSPSFTPQSNEPFLK